MLQGKYRCYRERTGVTGKGQVIPGMYKYYRESSDVTRSTSVTEKVQVLLGVSIDGVSIDVTR